MTPRRSALFAALFAVLALSGCAAGQAAAQPVPQAFDGDCAQVLTDDELATLVGSAPEATTDETPPVVTGPGMLECAWQGSERSVTVTALPASAVPGDTVEKYSLPECAPDTGFCGGSVTVDDLWILVDFDWIDGEWEPTVSTALSAVQRSAERL